MVAPLAAVAAAHGGDGGEDDEDEVDDEEEEDGDEESADDGEEEDEEEEEEEEKNEEVDEEEGEEDVNEEDAYKEMKDYAVGSAYTVKPTPSQENINPKYLIGERVAVRYELQKKPVVKYAWWMGIVEEQITTGTKKGRYNVCYSYDRRLDNAILILSTYGCDGEWVLLSKKIR